ncbi:hypothetical protein [Amycolatopsis sp. cmx-4-68]|uniref:hypothetical protein n=1 Tax=Amycolatopsis sp. cmx-4-68 TaxID=2790938 RepID=UPI00397DE1B7
MTDNASAAQKLVGDLSPKLAELTDDVLFGDVWERRGLAKRDRSLLTISAIQVAREAFAAAEKTE